MSIIIGADMVPTSSNIRLFENEEIELLIGGDLKNELNNADFSIVNLEVPLTDVESPIAKHGPNLIAPTVAINGYKAMNVKLVTLANNHIMDQGKQGLISTINTLAKANIDYVGAGLNAREAKRTFSFSYNKRIVGVYACCEHEFSASDEAQPGANVFDVINSFRDVRKLKEESDFVIVLYHGGKEHYRYPSPDLQKYCREFALSGADLVICQHSHCVGCRERYMDCEIVYGQGNFIFDDANNDFWNNGLLIKLDENFDIKYIPIVKNQSCISLAKGEESKKILENFYKRSDEILEKGFISDSYHTFTKEKLYEYLWTISGASKSKFLRIINKLSGYKFYKLYIDRKYDSKVLLALINYIECEAHKEVLLDALKQKMKKI